MLDSHLPLFISALALVLFPSMYLTKGELTGPTPYPDTGAEKAWPGWGPIRVFAWMKENRAWFWTQRAKAQGAVVFVGDSLTGNWNAKQIAELFPNLKIANRGIGGDTSRGVLFRFQEDVLNLNPRAVVLCVGSNDLSAHGNPIETVENISTMIALAYKKNAKLPIVLCTVPPRDAAEAPTKPGAHKDLNTRIMKFAEGKENLALLDLFPLLSDADGKPVPEYFAKDRLHLAPPGYKKWAEALTPVLAGLKIE